MTLAGSGQPLLHFMQELLPGCALDTLAPQVPRLEFPRGFHPSSQLQFELLADSKDMGIERDTPGGPEPPQFTQEEPPPYKTAWI